jgi:hypothetical protein
MTSFEVFRSTIEKLSGSQGYYARAYNTYLDMTEEEKINLENYINLNKKYNDSIDVIMDLEG